jgi:hypothetical protein
MKPILRSHQYHEFKTAIDNAVEKHIKDKASFPFQNCLNCMEWEHEQDLCGKYNLKPPTEILIYSCPDYKDDGEIPY